MRKFTLIAATAAVFATGLLLPTADAFAMGCLNRTLVPMDLTHDAMKPGAGWGYDKPAYDAELAKGNKCPTTEQSTPTSGTSLFGPSSQMQQQQTAQQQ